MRWRNVSLTACSALALAACGSGGENANRTTTGKSGPAIARAVAEPLAVRSDRVADLLDSNDACGAASEASRLESDLISAINRREIPPAYLEDLLSSVHEIQAKIPPCEVVQVPPPPRGKGKGKGKKHKHGHEGDD